MAHHSSEWEQTAPRERYLYIPGEDCFEPISSSGQAHSYGSQPAGSQYHSSSSTDIPRTQQQGSYHHSYNPNVNNEPWSPRISSYSGYQNDPTYASYPDARQEGYTVPNITVQTPPSRYQVYNTNSNNDVWNSNNYTYPEPPFYPAHSSPPDASQQPHLQSFMLPPSTPT
ncbi:hypothetical protein EJ08DRAFT_654517 [Tothia fuscella]|uniref:Uncharacterized protein n=1 Tax=Tothia fuscella TaxID=1048955 RepID=A0A9P4TSK3_9PEZI|nr:hypothetical protein EJ08DRAFT_654517 [Tothia fuscella]